MRCTRPILRNIRLFANFRLSYGNDLRRKKMSCNGNNFRYPTAKRQENVVDDYHGVKIADPYRQLEDPDGQETKEFVDKCNEVSSPYLQGCKIRDKIHERLTRLWDYPKQSVLYREGNHYFSYFNTGLQNQSVLYIQEKLDGERKVFLDPNALSEDGTTSLSMTAYTHDGTMLAYGLSEKGSDWVTVYVVAHQICYAVHFAREIKKYGLPKDTSVMFKKIPSGEVLSDKLEGLRYSSLAWTHDNKGVFYNKYPDQSTNIVGTNTTKNEFQSLYFHVLGTPQSEDILCYDFPDQPEYMIGAQVTEDGRYLVCTAHRGCDPTNLLYYYDLSGHDGIKKRLDLQVVIGKLEWKFSFVSNDGPIFTILTDAEAPLFKLVQIDITKPQKENWKILIKEDEHAKLDWVELIGRDKLVVCYMKDVKNVLQVHSAKTGEHLYTLPLDIGTVAQFSGKEYSNEIFYKFQDFFTPGVIYRVDLSEPNPKPQEFLRTELNGVDSSKFETRQVFYTSKDGTKVPMYIFHSKGLKLDGTNPCLLYGYGGFNASILPYFSVSRILLMQHFGGVNAIANIRGGSEYGEKWHQAAMKEKKQNVFDDFITAAEYLIDSKYTNRDKLAIQGGSNGGLLVAAVANQRPDLFGCVINQCGVLDMLRFHNFTIGHAWVPEFGCSSDANEFKSLIKYSPLHNLKIPDGGYPAMLLLTADHDDRVVPLHSLKYMAQLYELVNSDPQKQKKPVLIRIDTKAGHGAGKPTKKIIEEYTDIYSFMVRVMELQWIQ